MADDIILKSALHYHHEGLCVIPIVPRDKRPAIDWTEFQTRRSTLTEVTDWFGDGHNYNIGVVHGEVSGNFISIDIDKDAGIFDQIGELFPSLLSGRVEQSGSREGYHLPLRLDELPNFGCDRKGQEKGNRTWKTEKGNVNIRARFCQTVVPPSIHPCGHRYRFIKKGLIGHIPNLDNLMNWLDGQVKQQARQVAQAQRREVNTSGDTLLASVLQAWPDVLTVFEAFGKANEIQQERNGEVRLLGNGGLLITENKDAWFCFEDEMGGGVTQAWGWCKYGPTYDQRSQFREVLLDMAHVAGIDTSKFRHNGNEKQVEAQSADRGYWARQYQGMWERVR